MTDIVGLDYEYIVGPRYRMEDVSTGIQSIKLEKDHGFNGKNESVAYYTAHEPIELPVPIAGAIIREQVLPSGWMLRFHQWHQSHKPGYWYARCEQCYETCKPYRRKNEPALWGWARRHRCPTVETVDG